MALMFVLVLQVFPEVISSWFIRDGETIGHASTFIRIHSLALPFSVVTNLLMGFFQAIKKSRPATALSLIRKGIFDIPAMFLLNMAVPLYGPMMCQPIMDIVSASCAVIMYRKDKDILKK